MQKNVLISFFLFIALLLISGCEPPEATPTPGVDAEIGIVDLPDLKEDVVTTTESSSDTKTEVVEKKTVMDNSKETISPNSKMKVHYIDVGQADATLLEFSDGLEAHTMLIDTGNWNSSEVVSYLHAQNIKDIDIIAITHPHADHIGQLSLILNEFNVSEVWMNGETSNSLVYERAIKLIDEKDIAYYEPEIGEIFDIGPLEVSILHPTSLSGSTNENSIAMRLEYGNVSFLFTGDGEQQAENEILASSAKLSADILQLGHHGSNTSTSAGFLKAVHPKVAIYSAGTDNQYGHPHAEVVNRVLDSGAKLYGTDVNGTVIVETDGKTFTVKTNKDGTISPISSTPPKTAPAEKVEAKKEEPKKVETPTSNNSCVNINIASEADVQLIKHIGPARAKDLIELRPYNSVDDLSRIKGIGPARIADIKSQGMACTGG